MKVNGKTVNHTLYASLCGELDESCAAQVRQQLDTLLQSPDIGKVVLDLSGVSFMDSTGIGFLIGRYKKLQKYGMEMYLENPNTGADKILELSGIYSIMPKI